MTPPISRDAAELAARLCMQQALEFWRIPAEWDVQITIERPGDPDTLGIIHMDVAGSRAQIEISPDLGSLDSVWEFTAHEVAHLVLRELDEVAEIILFPDEMPTAYLVMLERTTWNLTRVFLEHHPYSQYASATPGGQSAAANRPSAATARKP